MAVKTLQICSGNNHSHHCHFFFAKYNTMGTYIFGFFIKYTSFNDMKSYILDFTPFGPD